MNASCALQHFCDLHGPQILLCTEAKPYVQDANDTEDGALKAFYSQYIKSENPQGKVECKSCTLSTDSVLASTIDTNNNMLFISSASTPNQELFKDIRNACVRSLNIEKSAELDFPVLFGDEENGYCLSLTFSCKDFHARGSQRLYALCYLCRDKYYLLSLRRQISDCMRQAVYWLQYDANVTYEQEGRMKVNTKPNGTSSTMTTTSTYIYRLPPRVPSQRMLSDMVHDSKLILRIHGLFVWILRTANSAMLESLFDALPTEEQTTKQERKDVFDQDNMNTSQIKRRTATIVPQSFSSTVHDSLAMSSTLTNTTQHPSYLATSLYSTINSFSRSGNGSYDEDDFDCLQYPFSSYGHEAFKLFELFIRKLNDTKHLYHILHHWVTGNRLILKYTNLIGNQDLIRALASVFQLFLPDGCCHLVEATNNLASCTANLVLLNEELGLANDALSSIAESIHDNSTIVVKIILDDIDDNLRVVKLETLPPARVETPVPSYVRTIVDLFTDTNLNDEAFEAMIIHHKIKYLNKAKLYFQLGRCQTALTSSPSDRNEISLLKIENSSDLLMIRFWQKGLSQAYRTQIRLLKQDDNQQKLQRVK